MNSLCKTVVFASILALVGLSITPVDARAGAVKSVVSHGWKITWGNGVATAKNLKTGEVRQIFANGKSAEDEPYYADEYEMLSVVGTIVSWSRTSASEENGVEVDWSSRDLNGEVVSLATLFGEKAVFDRLMRDPVVRAAAGGEFAGGNGPPKPNPTNLAQLVKQADGGCFAAMGDRLLSDYHFAYRLGGNIAVVQIGLSESCQGDRRDVIKLNKLYFPITRELREDFNKAVRSGVLKDRRFQRTSFRCAKADTAVEFAICTDAAVAKLDLAMARRHGVARRVARGEAKLKLEKDQQFWLKKRNRECSWPGNKEISKGEFHGSIEACLTKYYKTRLAALK